MHGWDSLEVVRDAQNVSVRTYAFRCSTRRVKRELFIAYTTSRMHSSQMTIKRLNKQKGLQDKQKKIFFFSSRLPTYTHYRDQEMGGQEVKLNEKKKMMYSHYTHNGGIEKMTSLAQTLASSPRRSQHHSKSQRPTHKKLHGLTYVFRLP